MSQYVIGIDFGTTMIAYAVYKRGDDKSLIKVYSPITHQCNIQQKTQSDIQFYLKLPNEQLSFNNSVLGTEDKTNVFGPVQQLSHHYLFSYYKNILYEKTVQVAYPNFPLVKSVLHDVEVKLSDIYTIVMQHVLASIKSVMQRDYGLADLRSIQWVLTVPNLGKMEQDNFMKSCFEQACQLQNVFHDRAQVQCVKEPEAALICVKNFHDNILPTNGHILLGIFDFGGGTYDVTAGICSHNSDPEIPPIQEYGGVAGGSNIDTLFAKDFMKFVGFDQLALSQPQKSLIFMRIFTDFQNQKVNYFQNRDVLKDDILTINILMLSRLIDPNSVQQQITNSIFEINQIRQNIQPMDDESISISQDGSTIDFLWEWIDETYIKPVEQNVLPEAKRMIRELRKQFPNDELCQGFVVGGFSKNQAVIGQLSIQENIKLHSFGNNSLAIVQGSVLLPDTKFKKTILNSSGIEILTLISQLSPNFQQLANQPEYSDYKLDQLTAAAILPLFKAGTDVVQGVNLVVDKYRGKAIQLRLDKEDNPVKKLYIIFHQFSNFQDIPEVYVKGLDANVAFFKPLLNSDPQFANLNDQDKNIFIKEQFTRRPFCHVLDIPQTVLQLPFDQQFAQFRFTYLVNESRPQIEYRWSNEHNFSIIYFNSDIQAPRIQDRIHRTTQRIQQNLPINVFFVIDKSGSMGASRSLIALLEQGQQAADNIFNTYSALRKQKIQTLKTANQTETVYEADSYLLDVLDAMAQFLTNRSRNQPVVSQQDRYGCIFFDTVVNSVQQLGPLDPTSLYNIYKQPSGETNYIPPIQRAIQELPNKTDDKLSILLFLTDGDATDKQRLLGNVALKDQLKGKTHKRIFCSFGDDPNAFPNCQQIATFMEGEVQNLATFNDLQSFFDQLHISIGVPLFQ